MTARRVRRPADARARRDARPSAAAASIRFGTSGWRGVLGEEVTFPRLRVLVRSIADWIREQDRGRHVLIAWDGRFASRAMAEMTAHVLQDDGMTPSLTSACTPTPALTHTLAHGRYCAGLVATASHNPPPDHGLKLFDASGATIADAQARRIEAIAARRMRDDAPPRSSKPPRTQSLSGAYLEALAERLDVDALRASRMTLVYDAMHGAASGYLDELMRGLGIPVEALRTNLDPTFGGAPPDPVAANLGLLVARTRSKSGLVLGIAHDGDGDRVGVVDGRGRVLAETEVIALLVDHLAATGRIARGVAIGAATGSLVERVARGHGLSVERHPIGFKFLSEAMLAGGADVAGEESGGFAWAEMGPDKDGILAGALLVELVARTSEPIESHLARIEARFGSSACGRIALARSAALERGIARLSVDPPSRIDRSALVGVDTRCGLRFELGDGGFLMFRPSGTEPIVRIYAEAADAQQLERRLRAGARLLARAGH